MILLFSFFIVVKLVYFFMSLLAICFLPRKSGSPGEVLWQAGAAGQAAAEAEGAGTPRASLQPVQGMVRVTVRYSTEQQHSCDG